MLIKELLDHTSTGNQADSATADFDVSLYQCLAIDINLTALTGTNVTFYYDRQDKAGVWHRVTGLGLAMTGAGQRPASVGENLGTNSGTAAYGAALGRRARIAWVGSGVVSMSFTISVLGK